jgi:DNA ligase (NAD+)
VRKATREELLAIPDVGEIVADSILKFFSDASIADQIDTLLSYGVTPQSEQAANTASPISARPSLSPERCQRWGGAKPKRSLSKRRQGCGQRKQKDRLRALRRKRGQQARQSQELNIPLLTEEEF